MDGNDEYFVEHGNRRNGSTVTGSHPVEFFPPLVTVGHASQAGGDVPETDVGVLRLQKSRRQIKTHHSGYDFIPPGRRETHHSVKHHLIPLPVLDLVVEVLREIQTLVDVLLKPDGALRGDDERPLYKDRPVTAAGWVIIPPTSHLGLPHEPELKDVDVSPALDGLVAGVVGDVVLFVLLEEVTGAHGVAACQDALQTAEHRDERLLTPRFSHAPPVAPAHLLSDQDGGTLQRNAHHLVRVPRDRVGPGRFHPCLNKGGFMILRCSETHLLARAHLSTPLSLWRCFLDIRSPPPHAP